MLPAIRHKIETHERLSATEAEWLFQPEVDLHAVGELADLACRRRHGNVAYYNINAHVNPTNVCVFRCPLCAYSCDAGDARAFVMSDDEILARAAEATRAGATELHIVGGAHPELDFDWALRILRRLHETFPNLHLKAFSAVEIARFAETAWQPVEWVLGQLLAAGLGSLPGGGAEIFAPLVRRRICPRKADGDAWLAIHKTAHRLGLRTNATMLYGHVETAADRVDHLMQLRQLQDETGGFQAFIPLPFHPRNTQLADLPPPSGLADLRTIAVSRLVLDNFDHVKAYWVSLGVGTAQAALAYGADDLDGTVRRERIYHDAGSQSPECLTVAEIRHLIREAGREPVERDSIYNVRHSAPSPHGSNP
jgi:aminodeoxyfutalosine synthase